MNMNTCGVMKAEALGLRFGASWVCGGGRRELRVVDGRGMGREKGDMVCRAMGGGKNAPKVQITYEKNLYQPFRPPVEVETPAGAATSAEQLEVLRERRGLWHEYAALIPILSRSGYTPTMIDEETGMTGVEQNIIVVASQVRNSLKASGFEDEKLQLFDIGGGELLYELRVLSAAQRKASAEFIIERNISPKEACELARSVKDFALRKNSEGFRDFTSAPGDCLAFALYRKSTECQEQGEVDAALKKALEVCVSEKAKAKIEATMKKLASPEVDEEPVPVETSYLQVIRLLEGEVVGTKLPTMLPVGEATLESVEALPARAAQGQGEFNVFSPADWPSWVAIPGWDPVVSAGAPVAINFPDAAKLPFQSNKDGRAKLREPTLVVVDKSVSVVDDNQSMYVVVESQEVSIVPASKVLDNRVLGRVVLALRPPIPPSADPVEWE